MPYVPVMNVAPVLVVRLVKGAARRRRSGPVEAVRILCFKKPREQIFVHLDVIAADLVFGTPFAFFDEHLHLVVAAPQSKACVVTKPADVVLQLRQDIFFKIPRQPVVGTGKHEILPYDKAHLIARIIEVIGGIEAAAPHADAVEVRVHALPDQVKGSLPAGAREDVVLRDIVSAHGEEFDAVYHMGEF